MQRMPVIAGIWARVAAAAMAATAMAATAMAATAMAATAMAATAMAAMVAAPAMAQDLPDAGIYSCTDAQGRRLTADRPIVACLDREQRVHGPSGVERARVGPSLTDAEREAQTRQRRQQLQAEQRARDEVRRQRALAYRYPDQTAHDAERAAAIAQIDDLTALAQRRVQDLRAERRKLEGEMEFYAKEPARAPAALRRQLALNGESLAEQARYLAAQEQEKRRIHQRFDAELVQLRVLWASPP